MPRATTMLKRSKNDLELAEALADSHARRLAADACYLSHQSLQLLTSSDTSAHLTWHSPQFEHNTPGRVRR
jgi:hypothetical protein